MSNLPTQHHRMNAHARHREKTLTVLLWVLRFRWTCASVIDDLLGGNGTLRMLIKRGLLVEHRIPDPFSQVRYYVTVGAKGLELVARYLAAVRRDEHGPIASMLGQNVTLPARADGRIREHRFLHDLHLQRVLVEAIHATSVVNQLVLSDDLERLATPKRPSKIPDALIEVAVADSRDWCMVCVEVEFSRKNQREIDNFCAHYRGALADPNRKDFDALRIHCEDSLLQGWKLAMARTTIPKWVFVKERRAWVKLDAKHWHKFDAISAEDIDKIVLPLPTWK